jgi:hypothetical protein
MSFDIPNVRLSQRTLALALTVLLVGCTPPYPTHKRTAGPGGVIQNLPNPSTVEVGKSRRDDVLSAFKEGDTGISSPWLFWGRWQSSSFAFSGVTDSGVEEIPIWSAANFLVEFDGTGTVKKSETLSDKRIIPELQRILAAHPESAAQTPAQLVVPVHLVPSARRSCRASISLSSAVVEFSVPGRGDWRNHGCPSGFSLPAQKFTVGSPATGTLDLVRLSGSRSRCTSRTQHRLVPRFPHD